MTDVGSKSGTAQGARLQDRIAQVRSRFPDLKIETTLAFLDADLVVFQASVAIPGTGSASAHIAMPLSRKDTRATTIEDAEGDAIDRALDRLGAGVMPAPPVRDRASTPSPNPGATPGVVNALRRAAPASGDRSNAPAAEADPRVAGTNRADEAEATSGEPAADSVDDGTYADYSWTAFWVWAKGQNISTRGQITAILGHQVDNMTPGAIRLELIEHGYHLKDA